MSRIWLVASSLLACFVLSSSQVDFADSTLDPILQLPLYGDNGLASSVPNGSSNAMVASVRSNLSSSDQNLFVPDVNFQQVFLCSSSLNSFLELDSFEGMIASPSSFAISFWFRAAGENEGENLGLGGATDATDATDAGGPQTLVVLPTGNATHIWIWLDNDGDVCVGDGCTEGLGLNDGDWHHVTVSTNPTDPTNAASLDVFVGGVAVTRGTSEVSAVDSDPSSSSLLICASANQDELFDGHVANLAVFDRGLNDTVCI